MEAEILKLLLYVNRLYTKICNAVALYCSNVAYKTYPDLRGRMYIFNRGTMTLGKGVIINSGSFPNPVGGSLKTIISVQENARLEIGDNVGISNTEIVVKGSVAIESGAMIGGGTRIYDSDFHPLDAKKRKDNPNINEYSPVVIEENAFIGAYCTILKGVTIGCNSVVGAGSVVTKDIPSNEIWAGNPAHFIRRVDI